MAAAIGAAFYARDAARHTAAGAIESGRAADAAEDQNRTWMKVEIADDQVFVSPLGINVSVTIKASNVGPWPALGVRSCSIVTALSFSNGWMDPKLAQKKLDETFLRWERIGPTGQTVFRDGEVSQTWSASENLASIEASMASNPNRDAMIFLVVGVLYWFAGKARRTLITYESSRTQFDFSQGAVAETSFVPRLSHAD